MNASPLEGVVSPSVEVAHPMRFVQSELQRAPPLLTAAELAVRSSRAVRAVLISTPAGVLKAVVGKIGRLVYELFQIARKCALAGWRRGTITFGCICHRTRALSLSS
jgi:hypothetical protein